MCSVHTAQLVTLNVRVWRCLQASFFPATQVGPELGTLTAAPGTAEASQAAKSDAPAAAPSKAEQQLSQQVLLMESESHKPADDVGDIDGEGTAKDTHAARPEHSMAEAVVEPNVMPGQADRDHSVQQGTGSKPQHAEKQAAQVRGRDKAKGKAVEQAAGKQGHAAAAAADSEEPDALVKPITGMNQEAADQHKTAAKHADATDVAADHDDHDDRQTGQKADAAGTKRTMAAESGGAEVREGSDAQTAEKVGPRKGGRTARKPSARQQAANAIDEVLQDEEAVVASKAKPKVLLLIQNC